MHDRSTIIYRALIVAYPAVLAASISVGFLVEDKFFEAVYEYRSSIHPGLNVTFEFWTALMIIYVGLLLAALVGLFLFWNPARWIILVALPFGYSIGYIIGGGPVVRPQLGADLEALSTLCVGAVIAMSFIGPISDRFQARNSSATAA